MKKSVVASLLWLALSVASFAQTPPTAHAGPQKLALLIGIDTYKFPAVISPLAGSVNDVESMKALLIGKFDFPPENVMVLENQQATHAAIISAIKTHLIAKAGPGDVVCIQFSGHGAQMQDVTRKKISGLDETIVPYDSRDPQGKVFDIPGSELHYLLVQLSQKTRNITFILDSCHSGTAIRGARVRSAPLDTRTPPPVAEYPSGERGLHEVTSEAVPAFTLIAASTSKESAYEHVCGGREQGALTCFLTRQLKIAKPHATWRDVMDPVISSVTDNYPGQHPQLEGTEADRQIFGSAVSLAQNYVPASPGEASRIKLAQGQVSGMTVGSIFDIFPPGTKSFDLPEQPTARVQVASVGEFTSEARLLSGKAVLAGSRAVERVHKYGKSRLRVYLDEKEKSEILKALSLALPQFPEIEVVADPGRCQVQLEETGKRLLFLGADRRTTSNPVAVDSHDALDHVIAELESWAKWFNVLSIYSALPGPEIQLDITDVHEGVSRNPFQQIGATDAVVTEGDRLTMAVTNNSARDLYITMLDLSADGSIERLYPKENGGSEVLKPGLSVSQSFESFIHKGRSSDKDTVKVFASTRPIDLTPLTQEPIRGATPSKPTDGSDPLSDLLAEASGFSRGLRPEGSSEANAGAATSVSDPAKVADWNTTQRTLRTIKK